VGDGQDITGADELAALVGGGWSMVSVASTALIHTLLSAKLLAQLCCVTLQLR